MVLGDGYLGNDEAMFITIDEISRAFREYIAMPFAGTPTCEHMFSEARSAVSNKPHTRIQ